MVQGLGLDRVEDASSYLAGGHRLSKLSLEHLRPSGSTCAGGPANQSRKPIFVLSSLFAPELDGLELFQLVICPSAPQHLSVFGLAQKVFPTGVSESI